MLNPQALQLRVGVDVGSQCHCVAVGLTDGSLLEEFEIPHTAGGCQKLCVSVLRSIGFRSGLRSAALQTG